MIRIWAKRLVDLEQTTEALAMQHDSFAHNTRIQLKQVFDAIRELMTPPEPQKKTAYRVYEQQGESEERRLKAILC